MPRIDCVLASGIWDKMEPVIQAALADQGIPVTFYDLELPYQGFIYPGFILNQ